jgi:CelD/BcsL family acetyltransferase involved in cellulose biosynthesis
MKSGRWSVHPALDAFDQFRDRWDALNRAQNNHLLLDSGFVSILLRHFGSRDVVLAVNEDPGNPAMALIERKGPGIWETFQPAWAPLGLILYGDGKKGAENLAALMRSLPGYAIQLGVLQQDPNCAGLSAAENSEWVDKSDYMQTARIPLEGTFEEYWASREDRLRKNNDRLRRRMAEKGLKLEFAIIRDPAGVDDGVREFGRLESKGWKASEGTAVGVDDAQARFYQAVLKKFCERNEGVIYQLLIDGQVVATDMCAVRDEMAIVIKTTYDEDWKAYAPGVLLREDIVRDLYSGGRVKNYEFYGPLMDYQLRWTKDVRTLYHLTCFRHPLVRGARNFAKRIRRRLPGG